MDEALVVRQLSKVYSKKRVLNQVNLTLPKGEIYGLIGKNGVGKTTLMRIVTRLSFQTEGEYVIFGAKESGDLERQLHRVGTMIETPAFFPYMTARQNLEYYRRQRGIVEKEVVEEVLRKVGLTDTGKKQFKNFSLGMKQRLGLALALLNSPDLLILDEPINGLDPQGIVEFRNVLKDLNEKWHMTMLISSHILSELSSIATCYGFMKDGTMVEEITAQELEEKCRSYIEIKVNDPNKMARLLEDEKHITKFEVLEDGVLRVYDSLEDSSVISEMAVLHGIRLFELSVQKIDLEQYFLNMIGGVKNA